MKRLVAILSLGCLVAACQPAGPPPGTTPIDELIQQGRAPIEVVSIARSMSPVIPAFNAQLKNVSDAPISVIAWTAVFADGDGKPLEGGPVEGGYADPLNPIEPGGTLDGSFQAPTDAAVSVKLVIKSIIYKKSKDMGGYTTDLAMEWENPNYAAELGALSPAPAAAPATAPAAAESDAP